MRKLLFILLLPCLLLAQSTQDVKYRNISVDGLKRNTSAGTGNIEIIAPLKVDSLMQGDSLYLNKGVVSNGIGRFKEMQADTFNGNSGNLQNHAIFRKGIYVMNSWETAPYTSAYVVFRQGFVDDSSFYAVLNQKGASSSSFILQKEKWDGYDNKWLQFLKFYSSDNSLHLQTQQSGGGVTGFSTWGNTSLDNGKFSVLNGGSISQDSILNINGGAYINGGLNLYGKINATGKSTFDSISSNIANVFNVKRYGVVADGIAEDSTGIKAAFAAAGVSGGTVFFPRGTYKCSAQLVMPWNSGTLLAKPITIIGETSDLNYFAPNTTLNGGSTLDLRYAGNNGKIVARGKGGLTIRNMAFVNNNTTDSATFIIILGTTTHIQECKFIGNSTYKNTAIQFGGNTINPFSFDGSDTSCFIGFNTSIRDNNFGHFNRVMYIKGNASGLIIDGNAIYPGDGLAAIEDDIYSGSDHHDALQISNNFIDGGGYDGIKGYSYGILLHRTMGSILRGNSFWDTSIKPSITGICLGQLSTGNTVFEGYTEGTTQTVDSTIYGGYGKYVNTVFRSDPNSINWNILSSKLNVVDTIKTNVFIPNYIGKPSGSYGLRFSPDNTIDIGSNGANRPKTIWFTGDLQGDIAASTVYALNGQFGSGGNLVGVSGQFGFIFTGTTSYRNGAIWNTAGNIDVQANGGKFSASNYSTGAENFGVDDATGNTRVAGMLSVGNVKTGDATAKISTLAGQLTKSILGLANNNTIYAQLYFDNATDHVVLTSQTSDGTIGLGTQSRTDDFLISATGAATERVSVNSPKFLSDSASYGSVYIADDHPDTLIFTSAGEVLTVGAKQPPSGYKWTSGGVIKNMTIGDSSVTVGVNGTYEVAWSMDLQEASGVANGSKFNGYIYVNDVKQEKTGSICIMTNAGNISRVSSTAMSLSLNKNDIVKLKLINVDDASGNHIDVLYARFHLFKHGVE